MSGGTRLHQLARIGVQPLAVHGDAVTIPQEAEPPRMWGARRHGAEADRLERLLHERQRVGLP